MTDLPDHVCGQNGIYWHGCEQCHAVNLARSPRLVVRRYLERYSRQYGREAAVRLGELIRQVREGETV